mgnify:CR=1 FL=1
MVTKISCLIMSLIFWLKGLVYHSSQEFKRKVLIRLQFDIIQYHLNYVTEPLINCKIQKWEKLWFMKQGVENMQLFMSTTTACQSLCLNLTEIKFLLCFAICWHWNNPWVKGLKSHTNSHTKKIAYWYKGPKFRGSIDLLQFKEVSLLCDGRPIPTAYSIIRDLIRRATST